MMQFSDDEWYEIALKLEQVTDAEKLIWTRQDRYSDGVYEATIPDNATYTLYSRDSDNLFPYVLRIAGPAGEVLGEFETISYGDEYQLSTQQSTSAVVDRIYTKVSRLVTGAPQKAKFLLDGLIGLEESDRNMPF